MEDTKSTGSGVDMEDEIDREVEKACNSQQLKQVAEQSAVHTEAFCKDCLRTEVDPFGTISGVQTPANKVITELVDGIVNELDLDPICRNDIRMDISEEFYQMFYVLVSEKEVETHIECFYCFENKQHDDDRIPVLVTEDTFDGMMTGTRNDWR